jgi:hypothetical protein
MLFEQITELVLAEERGRLKEMENQLDANGFTRERSTQMDPPGIRRDWSSKGIPRRKESTMTKHTLRFPKRQPFSSYWYSQRNTDRMHMDVVTAFLNPKIDRSNIHMETPSGIEWLEPHMPDGSVLVLRKALYGLKQAPRLARNQTPTTGKVEDVRPWSSQEISRYRN